MKKAAQSPEPIPIRVINRVIRLPRFTRIITFTGAVLDVFSEALRLTDEAEKRYPLVEG